MVKSKVTSRLSSIDKVILIQTDTTVGFVSQNGEKLSLIKSRESSKPFIKIYSNFKTLALHNHRIPNKQKKMLRNRFIIYLLITKT